MTPADKRTRLAGVVRIAGVAALVAGTFWIGEAEAGLGEPIASVVRDHAALRGTSLTTTSMPAYDRNEIMTADGVKVHEFAARAGAVFAFDFSGPAIPDLKTLLADHYDDYLTAARVRRGNHHVVSFATNGLVMTIMKLPRGFRGSAHVPALLPDGVSAQDLQ